MLHTNENTRLQNMYSVIRPACDHIKADQLLNQQTKNPAGVWRQKPQATLNLARVIFKPGFIYLQGVAWPKYFFAKGHKHETPLSFFSSLK